MTFKAAPNAFASMSLQQVRKQIGARQRIAQLHDTDLPECPQPDIQTPKHLDWRIRGAVNYVKDQAFCGSCWTFATMGMAESRMNILQMAENKSLPMISLSEQSIVDCFWDDHEKDPFLKSNGCEGGQPDYAIQWLQKDMGSKFALEHEY